MIFKMKQTTIKFQNAFFEVYFLVCRAVEKRQSNKYSISEYRRDDLKLKSNEPSPCCRICVVQMT